MARKNPRGPARAFLAVAMATSLLAACSATDPGNQRQEGGEEAAAQDAVINVALSSDVDIFDPHQFRTDAAYVVTANAYEPLLRQVYEDQGGALQGTGKVQPGLAESYEISDDGLEVTFRLREDAAFEDGSQVTSADVKYTFERAMLGPGYIQSLLPFIGISEPDQIETPDERTVILRPSFKSPLFETFMTFQVFGALNADVVKEHGTAEDEWATEWLTDNVTASGAYTVASVERGQATVLEPNEHYYAAEEVRNGGVRMRVVPDPDQRALLLRSGDLDVVDGLAPRVVSELEQVEGITVHQLPSSRITYLGMNNDIEPLNDPLVRQAISYAVPYEAIVEHVQFGFASPAKSPVPPAMESHAGDEIWPYDTDPEKARELLEEAGYGEITTQLVVRQAQPQDTEAAVFIQEALREVGVNVEIERLPDAAYYQRLNEHSLPMFLHDWFSWGEDPFFQMGFLLGSDMATNYANYSNPELDALLEEGTFELDPERRAELSRQAQEVVVNDAPWAFLYSADYIVATRDNISGVTRPFDQALRFEYMSKSGG